MVMVRRLALSVALAAASLTAAEAKPARCYTTEDGSYACDFRQFGGDGSFSISAPTKPTYTISIVGRDFADGFANYGDRNVPLAGTFYRDDRDRACWVSDATNFVICAY